MSTLPPPPGLTVDDYEQIESAVMETARGRWFLMEFARRVRANESQILLDAIDRLSNKVEANFSNDLNRLPRSLTALDEVEHRALQALPQPDLVNESALLEAAPAPVMAPTPSPPSVLMARLEANLRQPVNPPQPVPPKPPAAPQEIDVRAVFAPLDVMGERERLAFFA